MRNFLEKYPDLIGVGVLFGLPNLVAQLFGEPMTFSFQYVFLMLIWLRLVKINWDMEKKV